LRPWRAWREEIFDFPTLGGDPTIMEIAFIVNEFPSVSETFVLNQITGLLDRGHSVDVFTRALGRLDVLHPDIERYRLMDRTTHLACPASRAVRAICGLRLALLQVGRDARAALGTLNVFRYGRGALSLSLLFETAPFFRSYDIVHSHFGHNGRFGAVLKRLGLQKKLVVTFHGHDIRMANRHGREIYGELWDEADCLVAISKYNQEHLLRFTSDPRKIVYHPVGIDLRRFCYRPAVPPRDRPARLISVARLVEEKGLVYGLEAVQRVLEKRPGMRLLYDIIGEGKLRDVLEREIDERGLQETVRLHGARDQAAVIEALRTSDILLAPSLAEALPLSLMEAHAIGLPVVATRVGSVDQIVLDGRTGFLAPPGDAIAFGGRLERLLRDPERWEAMGRAGREHVERHYDIERLNDRLVELYQGLLAA